MARLAWAMLGAAVCLFGCAESGLREAQVGSVVTPGNTQVPLPPGQWTMLGSVERAAGVFASGGPSNQQSFQGAYGKIEDGRLTQVLIVSTSAHAPSPAGYMTGSDCIRPNSAKYLYYNDVRSSTPDAIDCVQVVGNLVFRAPGEESGALYRQAHAAAAAYGGMNARAVRVNFAEARSGRFLNYSMYFLPGRTGHSERLATAPAETMSAEARLYVDGIIAWAKQFRPAVNAGTADLL